MYFIKWNHKRKGLVCC